jgi:hypothetical protein
MAVWAMPFFTLNVYIGERFGPMMSFKAGKGLMDLARLHMEQLRNVLSGSKPVSLNECLQNTVFVENVDNVLIINSLSTLDEINFEYHGEVRAKMVGSFLGGEFANCVFRMAHREINATTKAIAVIDPYTYTSENSTVVSKLAMLAASEFMVASGIMLGSLISERDMQSEDCIARMGTALYLVYIHMLMHMSGVSDASLNKTDKKTRDKYIDDMRKSNPPIQEMCKIALERNDLSSINWMEDAFFR